MPAGPTYEPIATTSVTSTSTAIDFTSIPSTYTDLRVIWQVKSNANLNLYLQFNSDSGANYSFTWMQGNGTSATSSRLTSQNDIKLTNASAANNGTMNLFIIDVFSYAGSTNKTSLISAAQDFGSTGFTLRQVALWRSSSAITSINLTSGSSMVSGTTATLYGIKAA